MCVCVCVCVLINTSGDIYGLIKNFAALRCVPQYPMIL